MSDQMLDRKKRAVTAMLEATEARLDEFRRGEFQNLNRLQEQREFWVKVLQSTEPGAPDVELRSLLEKLQSVDNRAVGAIQEHLRELQTDLAHSRKMVNALGKMRDSGGGSWDK